MLVQILNMFKGKIAVQIRDPRPALADDQNHRVDLNLWIVQCATPIPPPSPPLVFPFLHPSVRCLLVPILLQSLPRVADTPSHFH